MLLAYSRDDPAHNDWDIQIAVDYAYDLLSLSKRIDLEGRWAET